MLDNGMPVLRMSHPDTETDEFLRVKAVNQGFDSIMTAGRPLLSNPCFSRRQIQIIADDINIFCRYLVVIGNRSYCVPAEIHISQRLHQKYLFAEPHNGGNLRFHVRFPDIHRPAAGQLVNNIESNIVAGMIIFFTGNTQS